MTAVLFSRNEIVVAVDTTGVLSSIKHTCCIWYIHTNTVCCKIFPTPTLEVQQYGGQAAGTEKVVSVGLCRSSHGT